MKTRARCLLFLILPLVLAGCGGPAPAADTQATSIAAGVAATLTAQAPPPQPVLVVTPSPPTGAATEPPPTIDLSNLRLEADGSGDLPSLEEALVQSEPGATITLGPGTFRLERALIVGGALILEGAGRDQTEIVSGVPDWVLRFEGDGPFVGRGIKFRHEGGCPRRRGSRHKGGSELPGLPLHRRRLG